MMGQLQHSLYAIESAIEVANDKRRQPFQYTMRQQSTVTLLTIILLSGCFAPPPDSPVDQPRFVPDVPVPQYPLCPPGSDCSEVHTCSSPEVPEPLGFTTNWTITGPNRMMSSPHIVDLTGDGILDIIVGTGVEYPAVGSILALDGYNGSILWEINATQEMFASAQFSMLDNDSTMDVILGGRNHELLAVSGFDGSQIWKFDSTNDQRENWYQFYTGQFIEDQNNDGIEDWLTSNGGNPNAGPGEQRDSGYMMILSGATGELLGVADMPDGRETYMSPLLFQPHPEMQLEVLFGTGGETWDGGLWTTSINDIMAGDISDAYQIVKPATGVAKGVMAPPSIVDITLDGILDIIVSTFDGRLIAIDGRNYSQIWQIDAKDHTWDGQIPDAESWASPTIGYFTDDAVPDVFAHYVIGAFPLYNGTTTLMVDGATGEILWNQTSHHTSFTTPLAVNLNHDARDEIVMIRGYGEIFSSNQAYTYYNQASVFNTCLMQETTLYNRSEMSIGTPVIADLDMDGHLEMLSTTTTGYTAAEEYWTVTRMNLNVTTPTHLSWAAYLGTNYDGVFESDS